MQRLRDKQIYQSRFVVTDFNTGTIRVSLQLSHIHSPLYSRTFNWLSSESESESESESDSESLSELLYDWRVTANEFVWATRPSRFTTSIFFWPNRCRHSHYVTSSLMRGWICCLQLLLVLASIAILCSESRGSHDHMLLSKIRELPNLDGQVPVFISPKHWVPLSFLRFSGLRWRYSNTSPYGLLTLSSKPHLSHNQSVRTTQKA
jgi:hypothetical protein